MKKHLYALFALVFALTGCPSSEAPQPVDAAAFDGGLAIDAAIDAASPPHRLGSFNPTCTGTGIPHVSSGVQTAACALGASLQVLRTNVGATDTEWATVSGGGSSAGATSGQVQTGDGAGAFTAPANVLAGASFVSIGATPAAASNVRLPNTGSIYSRNAANGADIAMMATDSSNNLWVGSAASNSLYVSNMFVYVGASNDVAIGMGGTAKFAVRASTGFTESAFPITGGSGFASASAYGVHGLTVHVQTGSGVTDTLSNAEYKNYTIKVTGTGANIIKLPAATDATAYTKYVWNAGSGTLSVQDANAVPIGTPLPAGQGAVIQFATSSVKQLTLAFTVN